MANYIPLIVHLSGLAVLNNVAVIKNVGESPHIQEINGYLRSLASGTFTVTVKNDNGDLISTLTWTSSGAVVGSVEDTDYINAGDSFHINVTSLGVLPQDLTIGIWYDAADH